MEFVFLILIVVVLILTLRAFMLWFWGINKHLKQQQQLLEIHLGQAARATAGTEPPHAGTFSEADRARLGSLVPFLRVAQEKRTPAAFSALNTRLRALGVHYDSFSNPESGLTKVALSVGEATFVGETADEETAMIQAAEKMLKAP